MSVTLLGPQRRPTLDQAVTSLDPQATVATVTAGWLEREPEDGELSSLLAGRAVNLRLYARLLDVYERDPELTVAEQEHRAVLDELQELYLVQLDAASGAVHTVAQRGGERPRARAAALEDAHAVLRLVDEHHLARVRAAWAGFHAAWPPHERPVVMEHREQLHHVLADSAAVVVAGGHVSVLARVLHLFHLAPHLPGRVVAWSAGAMALTERIVLFHDRGPHHPAHAEVYDDGVSLLRGMVLLPHARRRMRVDDPSRMAVLARRFVPARCVVLDDGVRLDLTAEGELPPNARVLTSDGRVQELAAA